MDKIMLESYGVTHIPVEAEVEMKEATACRDHIRLGIFRTSCPLCQISPMCHPHCVHE